MPNDLNIIYSGGSGGFLLLHFLLLSDQYYCNFNQDNDLISQWNIINPSKWKSTEIWPDNLATLNSPTNKSKIYFFFEPVDKITNKYGGKNLVIYTSFINQITLASYKRANWFCLKGEFGHNRDLINVWRQHYNNIKDPSWPACPNLKHFERLPKYIQQEILNNPYTKTCYPRMSIKSQLLANNSKTVNNTIVYNKIAPSIADADIAIKLEDFVNDHGNLLLTQLNLPPINILQQELINKWKNLHPSKLLKQINILP